MRRIVVSLVISAVMVGPLSSVAQANTCKLQEKLGIVNVKECEA